MANTTTSTGSSGSDTLYASDSGSKISAGARDDTLVGGTQDVYTGGSGVDTVMIEFTLAQWLDAANQQQITDYLAHLVKVTNPETDQVSNGLASDEFVGFDEQIVTVTITGTNDAAVITGSSTASLTETNAAQRTGGDLDATDIDSSAAFAVLADVAGSNGHGIFSIDATAPGPTP